MQNIELLFFMAAGLVSIAGVVRFVFWPIWRETQDLFVWWRKFQRDWDGEDAEPGRARVPGVMERLNQMDGQLQRNGGESLKDKVCDTHRLAQHLSDRMVEVESRQKEIADRVVHIEYRG
jgi:hypothetical protein